jgi:hypothetical protein
MQYFRFCVNYFREVIDRPPKLDAPVLRPCTCVEEETTCWYFLKNVCPIRQRDFIRAMGV